MAVTLFYDLRKGMTILRERSSPSQSDPDIVALGALGWILSDEDRAQRLLALTGLTSDGLRQGLGDRTMLCAVLDFLCAHEPDLIACAETLGLDPVDLARTRERLEA